MSLATLEPVRPFGLTRAVPVADRPADLIPALTLCPTRQVSITADGQPFTHAPSMATAFVTTSQTREDSQLDESTENDTDR